MTEVSAATPFSRFLFPRYYRFFSLSFNLYWIVIWSTLLVLRIVEEFPTKLVSHSILKIGSWGAFCFIQKVNSLNEFWPESMHRSSRTFINNGRCNIDAHFQDIIIA